MLRVGLIGCGAIGAYVARAIDRGVVEADLKIVFDIDVKRAETLVKQLERVKPKIAESIDDLIREDLDVVVEAASIEAVKAYAIDILRSGKNLIVLSTGALLDERLLAEIMEVTSRSKVRVFVPSGAIGGLDALKAASLAGMEELVLITRKSPESLGLRGIDKPQVVFEGEVEEAVERFPLNLNVAATLYLATGVKPKVRVIADPEARENTHSVYARGGFGEISISMSNKKIEGNPRTSLIAALSVVQLLRELSKSRVSIGT